MTATVSEEYSLRFPLAVDHLDQDEEFFWIKQKEGKEKRLRFHDYDQIYPIPGLYEFLFYEKMNCNSHRTIRFLLEKALSEQLFDPANLSVLDVGAGNGMAGEQLRGLGVQNIVGVDIIEEAAHAANRDRPNVYIDYHVVDLTSLSNKTRECLAAYRFNCLMSVAALGFGDIPPLAFAEAYNLISTPGWIAFNIKDVFLCESNDVSGFCKLIRRMIKEGNMDILIQQRYCHRLSLSEKPLFYVGIVAKKKRDIPFDWLDQLDDPNA